MNFKQMLIEKSKYFKELKLPIYHKTNFMV